MMLIAYLIMIYHKKMNIMFIELVELEELKKKVLPYH